MPFTKDISKLIQSQTQLLSPSLCSITESIYLFNSFKYYSSTLTSIKFESCNFTNISSFDGLKYLTQLRSLQFIQCNGLTQFFYVPVLNIKLLKVDNQISGTDFLLQKVGIFLELGIVWKIFNRLI